MKSTIITFAVITSFAILLVSCTGSETTRPEQFISPGSLPMLKPGRMIQVSSYDTTGGNNDRINIPAGTTATIFQEDGPGVITRIWLTIDSRDPHFLRRILLRFYWDGEENPSIESPVGDFFGTGFQYKSYSSEYLGMTSGGYYCFFPMPFQQSAKIEVVNQTGQEVFAFYYHIGFFKTEAPLADDVAYFHAQWRRDIRTSYPENYTILKAKGSGHLVGVNLNMQPYTKSYWYLEGDEMVWVDADTKPSVYGTGTEDYFTSGWYFNQGEYAAPYHGLILKDEPTRRIAAYRHHIFDPIPFKDSILFTIEHGHANEQIVDFSSVAYWYQKEPHQKFEEMKPGSLRIPLRTIVPNGLTEAENLTVIPENVLSEISDMSNDGPEWSNGRQLTIHSNSEQKFSLLISNLTEYAYEVDAYLTSGPDYGQVAIYNGNSQVATFNGFSDTILPRKVSMGKFSTENGSLKISFKTVQDAKTGIDGFFLKPVREYIPEWKIIGPFPNRRESDILRYGLDEVFAPEQEIDFGKTYTGAGGQPVKWKTIKTPENGYFSLWDKVTPYEFVVTYAVSWIYSPAVKEVVMMEGSDDGIKVFLNDEPVFRFLDVRIAAPDQDTIPLNLKKGWNKLMLKVENNFGGYAFYARIVDRERNLIFKSSIGSGSPDGR